MIGCMLTSSYSSESPISRIKSSRLERVRVTTHDESAYFDHVPGSKGDSSMILAAIGTIDVAQRGRCRVFVCARIHVRDEPDML